MNFTYEVTGDARALGHLKNFPGHVDALIRDALDDIALFAESDAKQNAGFKTGALRRAIVKDRATKVGPDTWNAAVGVSRQAPHGLWHHEGTGIYGSRGLPITPTRGRYLVFRGMAGNLVFAKSVRGQRANPYIRDAWLLTARTYVPIRVKKLENDLARL